VIQGEDWPEYYVDQYAEKKENEKSQGWDDGAWGFGIV